MDYSALVKQLTLEMKKGAQYKRIDNPFRIFAIVAMIPLIVSFILTKLGYWCILFFYKMLDTPAEALHKWLRDQKDEVQHATQAVMYWVCLPAIFSLRLLQAFCEFAFFVQWFALMVQGYLLTLGGIKWQPFLTDVSFDEDDAAEYKPGKTGAIIFSCVACAAMLLSILFVAVLYILYKILVGYPDVFSEGYLKAMEIMRDLSKAFANVHLLTILVINPIFFRRVKK